MLSLTEKNHSCDNLSTQVIGLLAGVQCYANITVIITSSLHAVFYIGTVLCKEERLIQISILKFFLKSIYHGIFTCHLVRHKAKGSGRLKSYVVSAQVQPIALSAVLIYFFSLPWWFILFLLKRLDLIVNYLQ